MIKKFIGYCSLFLSILSSMFTKEERKEFVMNLVKKYFFPDFSNKLTWFVVTSGFLLIATHTGYGKLFIYNLLIGRLNLNSEQSLIESETACYIGFGLIFMALIHNILYHMQRKDDIEKINKADKNLFDEFLKVFPSNSNSIYLLKNHDFGGSFSRDYLDDIQKFINEWNHAEKKFITPELDALRKNLWDKCSEFIVLLSQKSTPTGIAGNGLQCVVPDGYQNTCRPNWIDEDIKSVNKLATEVFNLHQNFIKSVKKELKC